MNHIIGISVLFLSVAATACATGSDGPSERGTAGRSEVASTPAVATAVPTHPAAPAAKQAADVARSAVGDWPGVIPPSRLADYGFADASEVAGATLGDPVPLHVLRPERRATAENDPNAYVDAVPNQYLVPILVGGQPHAFLRTRIVNGVTRVVGLGDSHLATEYEIALEKWPPARGFGLRFARRDAGVTFLLVDDGKTTFMVPLQSAARLFHFDTPRIAEVELEKLPPVEALMERVRTPAQAGPRGNNSATTEEK